MGKNESCRTCRHCTTVQSRTTSWCNLRKIQFQSEIAAIVFCHHWTKSATSLPVIQVQDQSLDTQLDFGKAFSSVDT